MARIQDRPLAVLAAAIRTATADTARNLLGCLSAMLSPSRAPAREDCGYPVKSASPSSASTFTPSGNQALIDTAKPAKLSLRGAEVGRESLR